MRKNLGKTVLFFILWHVNLFGSTYTWEVFADKTEAFVHEPIYLKYVCRFSDRGELYSIDFHPEGEDAAVSVKLLSQHETIVANQRIVTYEYVAFAKKEGMIDFAYDYTMKKTTKGAIENTVIGRDNIQKEQFEIQEKRHKPLRVTIHPVAASLVGEFVLDATTGTKVLQAHEPFHLLLSIEGEGSFYLLQPLEFAIDGVEVFTQEPSVDVMLHKEGYKGRWSQSFAFVGDANFTIPKIALGYFNPKTNRVEMLETEPFHVAITKGFDKETLLDELEEPHQDIFDKEYLFYVLFFLLGFGVAKIKFTRRKKALQEGSELAQKIAHAKSFGELCVVLALSEKKEFSHWIDKIENKEVTSIKDVKKELSRLIQD